MGSLANQIVDLIVQLTSDRSRPAEEVMDELEEIAEEAQTRADAIRMDLGL